MERGRRGLLKPCKRCGKLYPRDKLSMQGYCYRCGMELQEEALRQLKERRGPIYEKWRRAFERARDKMIARRREAARRRRVKNI